MNAHVILPSPRNDTNITETKPLRSRWRLCCRMKTMTKASMLGMTHHERMPHICMQPSSRPLIDALYMSSCMATHPHSSSESTTYSLS